MSLNRQQREKFVVSHMCHKYNLLHVLPGIEQTQLSGLYLKSFYNGARRNRLQLPDHLSKGTKFCDHCGVVYLAGVTLDMKVEESDKKSDEITKKLNFRCLSCSHSKVFPLETKPAEETSSANETFVAKWPAKPKDLDVKRSKPKERAKKRKLNSLSSMLTKKREDEAKKKKLSLSLNDFLQK